MDNCKWDIPDSEPAPNKLNRLKPDQVNAIKMLKKACSKMNAEFNAWDFDNLDYCSFKIAELGVSDEDDLFLL